MEKIHSLKYNLIQVYCRLIVFKRSVKGSACDLIENQTFCPLIKEKNSFIFIDHYP